MDWEWIVALVGAVGVVIGMIVKKTATKKDDRVWEKVKATWAKVKRVFP